MSTLGRQSILDEQTPDASLFAQAQRGDRDSIDALSRQIQGRLYSYIYRCTLDADDTNDLVQETLIEMVRLLGKLGSVEHFWPWLRAVAYNKVRNHRRREKLRRGVSLCQLGNDVSPYPGSPQSQEGLADLMSQELKHIIKQAMREIKPQYRDVLSMRCYEGMEYDKIAALMDRSPFATRMMFFRAKRALATRLARRGLGKASLLTALVVFGKMTAPTPAAAAQLTVTAASLKVGAAAAAAATSTTTAGAAAITLTLGGAALVTAWGAGILPQKADLADRPIATSPSFGALAGMPAAEETREIWYYLPEGRNGSVMMRLVRGQSSLDRTGYLWLQNHTGNYFYDRTHNTIYINNFHTWKSDLTVRELPTDSAELRRFLARIQGTPESGYPTVVSDAWGLLIVPDGQIGGGGVFRVQPETPYSILSEEYFQYNWPAGAEVVDGRDAMHRQGWAAFSIAGQVHGRRISGVGRIPFVHGTSRQYPAWLRIEAPGRFQAIDGPDGAAIQIAADRQTPFAAGSLFEGLSRPWMGLHTLDTVRRDAARYGIAFETEYRYPDRYARVSLLGPAGRITYAIDMEKDLVDQVTFYAGADPGDPIGSLKFTYEPDFPAGRSESAPAGRPVRPTDARPDRFWLMNLPDWLAAP